MACNKSITVIYYGPTNRAEPDRITRRPIYTVDDFIKYMSLVYIEFLTQQLDL